jgi:F0F1-type ATP synthase membrane subunit b/b'
MAKEITSDVEALEAEAEKILAESRTRASEILLEAKQEAKKTLSSELALDEVKAECERIVSRAKAEADEKVKESQRQATAISTNADKKLGEIAERVVNIVRGKS